MNYGLYTAFLGMRARQRTLEVQANNLANASTTGFKGEKVFYSTVEAENKAKSDKQNLVAAALTSTGTDFTAGAVRQTGNALDISIEGDAFLQIQTPRGVRYTRTGDLNLNSAGQLVTKNGDFVVGERGPISVPNGKISIGSDGTLAVDNQPFDKLRLVRFNNPASALSKEGDTLFLPTGNENPQENISSTVIQGSLESSNVNSLTEMVAMINNTREFESLQKNITLLMNDVGRKISGEIGKI